MLEWGKKTGGQVPILLDGEQVATVDPEFWREGAELVIAGQTWQFARDGGDRIARLASAPDQVVLRATKKGLFSQSWLIRGDGVSYEIGQERAFGTRQQVLRDGQRIGTSDKTSFWASRPTLDIDQSVPPIHQLFLLWISHVIRKRAEAAAAS